MPAAELKRRWKAGEVTYGSVVRLGSSWVTEVFAQAGLDAIWIDQQHGLNPEHQLVPMLQSMNGTNVTPLVRVPANDDVLIGRALDAGAEGVIVPMVETAEDARRAVAACRHMPDGIRSYGVLRLRFLPGGPLRETICLVMVETGVGVSNVDEIVSVPGVDGVFIGPIDLSLSLGLGAGEGIQPGAQADAIDTIRKACDQHNVVCGITGDAQAMRREGFRFISIGGDSIFLLQAMEQAFARR